MQFPKSLLPMIRWWFTPKLPVEHIFISPENRPSTFYQVLRVYFRKWVVHPVKRRVARYYLRFLQKFFGITIIAITGSAGKTTTKEMITSILSQMGETVFSFDNIDPVYNIPTTILSCKTSTKYLVIEMGVEFPGEMDFYLWLARPHVTVITNIHPTHTQFFKSERGVAKEKGKLVKFLGKDDFAVLNWENKFTREIGKKLKAKVEWFGKCSTIDADNIELDLQKGTKFTLKMNESNINVRIPVLGRQFVENALAASAVGYLLSASLEQIKNGLESFNSPEHRMKALKLKSGAWVLDDSYNNNPVAAKEALKTLRELARGRKIVVVFGDMLELGSLEEESHIQIGKILGSMNICHLIGVGLASKILVREAQRKLGPEKVDWVEPSESVLPLLSKFLRKDTIVLIKGSRSIGLDKIVPKLL